MKVLIVDGYNVIHAWPRLKQALVTASLEDARTLLVQTIAAYAAHTGARATVVFDAHGQRHGSRDVVDGVDVVYGTRTASADHVIERLANEAARRGDAAGVVVVTGDRLQRALVAAMGAATMSPQSLLADVQRAAAEITQEAATRRAESSRAHRVENQLDAEVARRLERLRRGLPHDGR